MSLARQMVDYFWPWFLGVPLFAIIVWQHWPIDNLEVIPWIGWGLLGLVCLVAPDEISAYGGTVISSHRSLTARESAAIGDDIAIRVFGIAVLIDGITGISAWILSLW